VQLRGGIVTGNGFNCLLLFGGQTDHLPSRKLLNDLLLPFRLALELRALLAFVSEAIGNALGVLLGLCRRSDCRLRLVDVGDAEVFQQRCSPALEPLI
jgi:hypothetical protein